MNNKNNNYLNNYINSVIENRDKNKFPKKINLIIDGGAFNCAYMGGCLSYIKQLENSNITKVGKISGCSAGALLGLMYLTDTLHYLPIYYSILVEKVRERVQLDKLHKIIKNHVKKEHLSKIDGRLFISYYNITTLQHTVVSNFKSHYEIIDCLIKSSFVPILINGKLEYRQHYCDGMLPYLFTNTKTPNLFISLFTLKDLKYVVYTKNDIDIYNKLFDGINDIDNFFRFNKGRYCSFIQDWSNKDFIYFRLRELISLFIIILIKYNKVFFSLIPKIIKENNIINNILKIILTLIKDILKYNIF